MAVLYKNGTEICRVYGTNPDGSVNTRQFSFRTNGRVLRRRPGGSWQRYSNKKAGVPLAEWIERKRAWYAGLPQERKISP